MAAALSGSSVDVATNERQSSEMEQVCFIIFSLGLN
jgi:hypothetical protein